MERLVTVVHKILLRWGQIELALGCVLFIGIIVLMSYQIFARTLIGDPLPWAEELATVMFIWMTLLGASAAVKIDRHITVASFDEVLGESGKIAIRLFGRFVMVAASIWVAVIISEFIPVEARSSSVALPIRIPKSYIFSIPLLVCCFSMAIGSILVTIVDLYQPTKYRAENLANALLGNSTEETGSI